MNKPTTWAVLLSIRKEHASRIYAGTKTEELRKTVPRFEPGGDIAKYPFRVYLYESKRAGGAGAVTGYFDCPGYAGTSGLYSEEMAKRAQVSMEYLTEYACGGWVYGWKVENPHRLPCPVPLSALGIMRPPQSWQYLSAEACKILEVAARGSPAV